MEHKTVLDSLSKLEYTAEPMYIPEEQWEIVSGIIDTILNNAWTEITLFDKDAENLRKKSRMFKAREPVQEARIGYYSDKIAQKEINTEFIDNVMIRLLNEICTES